MTGRRIIAVLVMSAVLPAARVVGQVPSPPDRDHRVRPFSAVVDSTDIARSGARRWSDVLALVGAHPGTSLDGFRYSMDAGVLSAPAFPGYRLRVDGIPVRIGQPFDLHPELIPVVPGAVRSVSVGLSPSAGRGGISPGGWVDIETMPPPEGLHVSGFVSAGNEVGDPGPFRYTPEATPNADRIGPVYAIRASIRADAWQLEGTFRGDEIHMTDPFLADRVNLLYRGYRRPRLLLAAPRLSVAHVGRSSRHRFSFGFSALRDLRFLPETGAEVPSLSRQWEVSLAGNGTVGRSGTFHYSLDSRQQDMLPRTADQTASFDHVLHRFDGEAGVSHVGTRGSIALSVGAKRQSLITRQRLSDHLAVVAWSRIDLTRAVGPNWYHELSLQADGSDEDPSRPNRVRFSGSWQQRVGRPGRSSLDLGVSWLNVMPEASESPWWWMIHGWSPPAYPRTDADPRRARTLMMPPYLMDSRTGTVDLAWTHRRQGVELSVAAFGRLFRGLNLAWARLVPDPGNDPRYVPTMHLRTGVGGYVLGGRFSLNVSSANRTRHRIDVIFQRPTAQGDVTFWEAWAPRPAVEASWSFSAEPVQRTWLHLQLRYRTRTLWPQVRLPWLAGDEIAMIPNRIDAFLTLSKRFWDQRVKAFVTFEHLFDTPIRTHPLGQSDRLTLHVGAVAHFGFRPQE